MSDRTTDPATSTTLIAETTAELTADAVVVGGGIAGLVAARALRARGLRVVVLEADDRTGGQVRGGTLDGLDTVTVDIGAEAFAARGTAVGDLIRELGFDVVEPAPLAAWGFAAGRAFPLPKTGVLGIPAHPWAQDVRRAVGWPGSLRASVDRILPGRWADTSTLDSFARSRMGSRVTERLVAPVATGVHSAPLDRLDVDAVAPGLRDAFEREGSLARAVASMRKLAPAGSAVRGIDGGMHRLVEALTAGIVAPDGDGPAGEIRLRQEVAGIEHLPATGDGVWRVTATDLTVSAPRLVVTTPKIIDLVGPLAGHAADPLPDPQPGADIRLMTLLLRAPELDDAPRGSGMLIAPPHRDSGRAAAPLAVQAKAMTHSTAKWPWLREKVREALGPGHHVVRLSYGRFGVTAEPDLDTVVADASSLFGADLSGRVLGSLATRWNGSLPPPTPAYRRDVAAFGARVADVPGLGVTGAWIAGTGLAAIVGHAQECAAGV